MKILFVKRSQSYPRSSGHDVHAYYLMRSLIANGASVSLLTELPVSDSAREGLELAWCGTYQDLDGPNRAVVRLNGLQEKFRGYWGIDGHFMDALASIDAAGSYDVVVVTLASGLPLLAGVTRAVKVWYVADDQMLHSWSLLDWKSPGTWRRFSEGLIHGLYERVFRHAADRVWLVSKRDAMFARWVMGANQSDVIPNGVDAEFYVPVEVPKQERSCIFWGRLDFAPNLDAIRWFGKHVWLPIRSKHPDATWSVYGFSASEEVYSMQKEFGFELHVNLPDLRREVARHRVVVLPFVSGAGVKNKLLEAAAMGMPILASSMATNGLEGTTIPIVIARSHGEWQSQLKALWSDPASCDRIGRATREWVVENHAWGKSARLALEGLRDTLEKRGGAGMPSV